MKKLMVRNSLDVSLSSLALLRGRCADFPSWPGVQHGAPSRGRIHDRNRISAIRAATLRTGLGPYTTVRIQLPPPTSPYFKGGGGAHSIFSFDARLKRNALA